ncbi:hypothetical protein [uncultured Bartonella sp.]|uniref:hypothetical protein n=1 Tax=uncultured Bartonella sp. TaxID=104108 RepID=UPI00261328E0|nr:hypothetical protein [uncultured Bartonella sp.]
MVRYLRDYIITAIHQVLHKGTNYSDEKVAGLFYHNTDPALFECNSNQTIHYSTAMVNRNVLGAGVSKQMTTFENWHECFAGYIFSWRCLAKAHKVKRLSLKDLTDISGIAGTKVPVGPVEQSKKAFTVWSIFVGRLEYTLLKLIAWIVALPTIGVDIDENHTKAIGKRFAPLV